MAVPETVSVILYEMKKDPATVGKIRSGDNINHTTVRGTFRGNVDLINPVLSLQRGESGVDIESSTSGWTSIDINKYNYFRIENVNRYYFITGFNILPTGLMILSGAEDPLETYKHSINNMPAYVARCEKSIYIDTEIPDNYIYTLPKQIPGSVIFKFNTKFHQPSGQGESAKYAFFGDDGLYNSDRIRKNCFVNGFWDTIQHIQTHNRYNDNDAYSFILTLSSSSKAASNFTYSGSDIDGYTKQVPDTPNVQILCTKRWLENIYDEMCSGEAIVQDYITKYSKAIEKVEIIPENIDISHMTTYSTSYVRGVVLNGYCLDAHRGPGTYSAATDGYAVLVSGRLKTLETHWESVIYSSSDDLKEYRKSSKFINYSISFEPFGTIQIPTDEILNHYMLYLKVEHDLTSGNASLFYSLSEDVFTTGGDGIATGRESVSWQWKKIAEAALSKEIQWVAPDSSLGGVYLGALKSGLTTIGNVASTMIPALGATTKGVSAGINKAVQSAYDNAETSEEFDMETGEVFYETSVWLPSPKELKKAANEGIKESVKSYISDPNVSTSTAIKTINTINQWSGLISPLNGLNIQGTNDPNIMDFTPLLLTLTREYVDLPTHFYGRPCNKWATHLSNYTSPTSDNVDGYYVKTAGELFRGFGTASEPSPITYELKMIADSLSSGVFMRHL